jgi:hypothetical protein
MARKKAQKKDVVEPAYQEAKVESVGGGPAGSDREDRSGEGVATERRARFREKGRPMDVFVSSEVDAVARRPGGYDPTRG